MRDPQRIPRILAAVQRAWEQNPDLRLGQMLVAAIPQTLGSRELFNLEDDRLEALVTAYTAQEDSI